MSLDDNHRHRLSRRWLPRLRACTVPTQAGQPSRGNTLHVEGQPSEAEWEVARKSAVEKSDALLEKHDTSIFSRKQ